MRGVDLARILPLELRPGNMKKSSGLGSEIPHESTRSLGS
jgi:hypothetical protein